MNHDIATLSAETLLAIPLSIPERLFTGDPDQARCEFRTLVAIWHPDRCSRPEATAVFQHLSRLYATAERKLRDGAWQTPGLLTLRGSDGTRYQIRYLREREFELGQLFIGLETATWLVEKQHADLFQNGLDAMAGLRFANGRMATQLQPGLPEIAARFETADRLALVMRKAPDLLLLSDVLAHFNGRMDARQVAWIISSLLNLTCYLDYARLAHNAILTDAVFISPPRHSSALLGGWWYAVRQGQAMRAAPALTVQYAPFDVINHQRGDIRTDLELVRAVGRTLLGDVSGARLVPDKAAPPAMLDWLRLPASGSPVQEYQTWQGRVLKASFGERRFVKLEVSVNDLY